jgi:hypothetical protein
VLGVLLRRSKTQKKRKKKKRKIPAFNAPGCWKRLLSVSLFVEFGGQKNLKNKKTKIRMIRIIIIIIIIIIKGRKRGRSIIMIGKGICKK